MMIIIIVYLVSVQNQPEHKLFSLRQTWNHVLFDVPSEEGELVKDGKKKNQLEQKNQNTIIFER